LAVDAAVSVDSASTARAALPIVTVVDDAGAAVDVVAVVELLLAPAVLGAGDADERPADVTFVLILLIVTMTSPIKRFEILPSF
jgi:hypothetical protein